MKTTNRIGQGEITIDICYVTPFQPDRSLGDGDEAITAAWRHGLHQNEGGE